MTRRAFEHRWDERVTSRYSGKAGVSSQPAGMPFSSRKARRAGRQAGARGYEPLARDRGGRRHGRGGCGAGGPAAVLTPGEVARPRRLGYVSAIANGAFRQSSSATHSPPLQSARPTKWPRGHKERDRVTQPGYDIARCGTTHPPFDSPAQCSRRRACGLGPTLRRPNLSLTEEALERELFTRRNSQVEPCDWWGSSYAARGNLTRKTAPVAPFRLSTSICPLCASTIVRTMERPMPIPCSFVE